MTTFILTFAIIFFAMMALAVGVLFGRGTFKASCGGNAVLKNCPLCKKDEEI